MNGHIKRYRPNTIDSVNAICSVHHIEYLTTQYVVRYLVAFINIIDTVHKSYTHSTNVSLQDVQHRVIQIPYNVSYL